MKVRQEASSNVSAKEADSESDGTLHEVDIMLLKAIQIVVEHKKPSISYLQRQLKIGYNKTCALVETMERYGIVSQQSGTAMRTVLVDTFDEALSRLPKR